MTHEPVGARRQYLSNHRRLLTSDLDEAREAMDHLWEYHRSVMKRGRKYGLRWHQAELVNTALSFGKTSSSLNVDCGPMSDSFRITMHEAGRVNHWIDGRRTVATPTHAVLHRPGQDLRLEVEPFELLLLTFDGPYVRRCLEQRFEHASSESDWAVGLSLTTPAGLALRSLTRWMAGELDRPNSEILASDCAASCLERTLLTLFLDCVSERNASSEPRADHLSEARVRRIEDWIDAHFAEPIGIEDLARVGCVSVRSVQTAFRRLRGCTPMRVVHDRRLRAAHAMLRRAMPGTTVTQVATECGFFNLGRFSHQFRERFGESPSDALARAADRAEYRDPECVGMAKKRKFAGLRSLDR